MIISNPGGHNGKDAHV